MFLLLQTLAVVKYRVPWHDGFFRSIVGRDLFGAWILLGLLAWLWRKDRRQAAWAIAALAAVYLVTFSVGLGGFMLHHYVFALPAYVAGWLALVSSAAAKELPWRVIVSSACVAGAMLGLEGHLWSEDYGQKLEREWQAMKSTAEWMVLAPRLDALLDHCYWDRYLPLGTDIYGFTRHSPLELSYSQIRAIGDDFSPYFREHFRASVRATPLIVINEQFPGQMLQSIRDPEMQLHIATEFTDEAPPCAAPYAPLESLTLLFRRPGS
jgi:hypothetical protein